jgi:hypothetical protein
MSPKRIEASSDGCIQMGGEAFLEGLNAVTMIAGKRTRNRSASQLAPCP